MSERADGLIEKLREDGEFAVFQVRGGETLPPRLLVVPAGERPAPAGLARLEQAYALRDELDAAWAARPLEWASHEGKRALLLHDPDGDFLDELLGQPMEVPEFLRLALGIVTALGAFHARGLIHRDVKPAHLLVNPATGAAWLTGFGLVLRLPRHRPAPELPDVIAGTLAYMAPEQTSRMNRSVDSRSDLYSLGVTLYEMLVGALPFTAGEPMEWVHCHLARVPTAPKSRVREIPEPLSAMVLKLLAKAPEDRYQTAAGVGADLRRCLAEWETQERIEPFALGAHDASDRLLVPEKLYGREQEVGQLLEAFGRVVRGGPTELVLVSGCSGVGKSSVVNELNKMLVPSRSLFASGKFDQFKGGIPYATLAQAFGSLVRQILTKSDAELGRWQDALRGALGPDGQLMVTLVPELALVVGEQPPVADLPPQDARYRFQAVFRRFLGAFARPEHPLALFLDDLQWLDAATLELLEHLATHPDVRHLLLVGAYRDHEVGPAHPLRLALEAVRKTGVRMEPIVLASLAPDDVGRLLADALQASRERVEALAQLVQEKTGGNPFFVVQFLTALAEEGLLAFDSQASGWQWDLGRIRAKAYTANVAELMVGKLDRLPPATQNLLKQFACLGSGATKAMLALVHRSTEQEVDAALWEAVISGLVLPSDGAYRFAHDRVQEAVYALIPEGERAAAHLQIGRALAAWRAPADLKEQIFEAVGQLNRGAPLITSPKERERVARVNLLAGKRAKGGAAYAAALTYLAAGSALLAEGAWERQYRLAFDLEIHRAECEILTGDLAAAEESLSGLAKRAANFIDRAAVTRLQTELYTTLDQSDRAVEAGLEHLRRIGVDWSPHPTTEVVRQEYEQIWRQLGSRRIEALADLPPMTDPACRATLDVLTTGLSSAWFTDANLHDLFVARMANLSLEHGNTDGSCNAYAVLGTVLGSHFGDYQAGFRFCKLGVDLVQTRGLERFRARVYSCFGHHILPWTQHLRQGRIWLQHALRAARETGDLTFAAFSTANRIANLLGAGDPLEEVQGEAENGLEFARKAKFSYVVDWIIGQLQLVRTLRGLTPEFGSFNDAGFDEGRFERHLEEDPRRAMATCRYWIRKLQARFHAGDHRTALAAASEAQRFLRRSQSAIDFAEYPFYAALVRAAACDDAPAAERGQHLAALAAHHGQIGRWAANCPENFGSAAALVGAELARLEGRELDAQRLYEAALRSAREHGFVQNEAIANELAAKFYLAGGYETTARAYLREASHAYARWGADGKVRQLDQRDPHLRAERASAVTTPPVEQLDVETVVKASQALSGEIVLSRLIETLLQIAVEHAGAVRGLLLLPRGNELRVEAEATTGHDAVTVCLLPASATPAALPESILRYVIRSRESVILDDALTPNEFSTDEYLYRKRPRSILCLPLVKQAQLMGVLYLENNLASHVFTPARIAVLQLLASQAAISLENARLYAGLQQAEEKAKQSEQELRLAVDTIPALAWSSLPDGSNETFNKQWHDYTGMSPQEACNGGWKATYHPEDVGKVLEKWMEILVSGADGEVEARIRRFDGVYRSFLIRGRPLRDERGAITKWYGTSTDIEDLKQAEALLAGEKKLLEMIATGHPLPVILDALCRAVEELLKGCLASILLLDVEGKRLQHCAAPSLPVSYTNALDGTLINPSAGSCGTAVYGGERVFVSDIATDPLWADYRELALSHDLRACCSTPILSSESAVLGALSIYSRQSRQVTPRERSITDQFTHLASIVVERKRAEDALKKSETFLAEGQRISHTGSWAWNVSRDKIVWSEEHCRIFGLGIDQPETTLTAFFERVHPNDRVPVQSILDEAVRTKSDFSCEYRIILPDGSSKHLHSQGRHIVSDPGDNDEFIGTTLDITERYKAKEALENALARVMASEDRLRTIIDTMPTLAWASPADGVGDFFSKRWLDYTGLSHQEAQGTGWTVAIHPEDLETLAARWTEIRVSEREGGLEARLRRFDGEYRWFLFRAAPLMDQSRNIVMWYGTNTDIEDLKQAEVELRRREADLRKTQAELAHVTRVTTMGELAASIAHEVNQPIAGVVLNGNACLRWLARVKENSKELVEAREALQRIIRDGSRAGEVITRIRALFKKSDTAKGPLDLNEAIQEVIVLVRSEMDKRRIVLRLDLAEDLPAVVGDRVQLQQVMLNLVLNAIEAMATVEGRSRELAVGTQVHEEAEVRVTVRDCGVGLDPARVEQVFAAFHTTKPGGLGMGLSISRSIVENHAGRLWATVNDGPGTTFQFTLSAHPQGKR